MASIGLILAVAAGGCCAYLAGLAIERWVTWPKPYGRTWAIVIGAMMTVANIIFVSLAGRLGMPTPWSAILVLAQVQAFIVFVVLQFGLHSLSPRVSEAFVCINIAVLAVHLVGMRLAFELPDMSFAMGFWWCGGSYLLFGRVAIEGLRQGRLQRAVRDGGLVDHVG